MKKRPTLTRGQAGLPEDAFVLCSFNGFHKINERVFNRWVSILNKAPNAVLWISLRGGLSEAELRKKLESRGVPSSQLVIAPRVADSDIHQSRLSLANLMLDAFPYNSHTTACDAISAGLPILTLAGESFASRVSGSLLHWLGVPDLIASDLDDYENIALRLYEHPAYYRETRERVKNRIDLLPHPQVFANNLEKIYRKTLCD